MLPIGVVLPTRNSISLLPDHLAAAREWIDHVQELVVVDSFSTDGTYERLQAELNRPHARFLQHPPGLYQSWNFGIGRLQSEFCYISTVGETITREGLEHLVEVMTQLRCDVAVSQPEFVDLQGRPMRSLRWPVEDMVRAIPVREPKAFEGAALFLFTLLNYGNAILGSSASNLYRTRILQQHPFPTDYGTAGDGGWGLEHCLEIRFGITPRVFSTFREHPKSYSRAEYAVDQLVDKMFARVVRTYQEERSRNARFREETDRLQMDALIELLRQEAAEQHRLEAFRRHAWPWSLNPAAWAARSRRNQIQRQIAMRKQACLQTLFP